MVNTQHTVVYGGGQPYKYGGKELERQHGLNQYDFGARWYDPARPGTTTMDPLCERRPWESEPIRKNHKFRDLEKVDDVRFHKTNGREYFK